MVNPPQDEPTEESMTIILDKVTECMRRFFEHIHTHPALSYPNCLEADRALRSIILDGPAFLKAEMSSAELLVVHRTFLTVPDKCSAYSRQTATEAARSIIQQLARSPPDSISSYWTLPYHTVSAATTLMLDIFQSPGYPDVPVKRVEVQHALYELQRGAPSSHIAARGVSLLWTLLAEETKHRAMSSGEQDAMALVPDPFAASRGESARLDRVAKRIASSSSAAVLVPPLPVVTPSVATSTTPFFASNTSSSTSHRLPPVPEHTNDSEPTSVLPDPPAHVLPSAPLSQQALEALFAGLGGSYATSERDGSGFGTSESLVAQNAMSYDALFSPVETVLESRTV
ncbi:C6 transcription factor [Rhodotorula toruloides]|uniref:C6 transcription factor n=1 Tax=Rhodotorula toruloides TaxID=5286 RepID=A0A511KCE1_RHOTO|nr:C6 transcription factor [Rhodotorula toruloides]